MQLGCFGDKLSRTPALDRLAADGTRFTRAYCTTASCSASRSVILTGLYNHATAHYGHEHSEHHFRTFETQLTLPVALAKAGYRTCSIGKYHVAPEETYHFERYGKDLKPAGAPTKVAFAAQAWSFLSEQDARPFFLYYCPTEPHRANDASGFHNTGDEPGVEPVTFDPAQITVPTWLPDLPEVRQELAQYYAAINRLDQKVGALISMLKATKQYDNTLIVFISDNGPPFPGAKTTLYEPGANLPMIVKRPHQSRTGVMNDARVTWVDITPTALALAGYEVTPPKANKNGKRPPGPQTIGSHGRSFLDIVEQDHPDGWDSAFLSHTFHEITMYYPMRALVSGKYKYIFNVAHELPFPFASDLYASRTWQAALKRGPDAMYGQRTARAYSMRARHELYDLEADPHETKNLADDSAHATTLAELQERVRNWQQQTRDPWFTKWTYE
ncbi:MAG: sulfatase [Planctomycetes bacterium]|nr:sulfatase [Planctomycetota bacterium]